MPKLYYTPTSCGAASFISAFTAGVNLQVEQVDLKTHKTLNGEDYYQVNPKGNVPALLLDNGIVLNEGAAILQWIADQAPNTIAPVNGTTERYLVQNALNYISSEVHPSIGGLLSPVQEDVKVFCRSRCQQKFNFLENYLLKDHPFLVGNHFTIADAYLYICLSWLGSIQGVDLEGFPRLKNYYERMNSLPSVRAAHARMSENPHTILSR